jgi:GTP-binding protein Era
VSELSPLLPPSSPDFRCGFVTLIGAPNVGKSTLLNQMIGEHLAITSKRPQTTRNRIPGVLTQDGCQLVFIDTPGLHQGKSALNRYMDQIAQHALGESDVVALLIEAGIGPDLQVGISTVARQVLEALKGQEQKVILIINKIDRITREHLLPIIQAYQAIYPFNHIVPVSALKGEGVDHLIEVLTKEMPLGPALYPKDILTDLPERFFAAEMIREKLFRRLSQEVPYSTAVTIDTWSDQGNKGVFIDATIHVERASQKGIVIGKGGSQLKQIGMTARQQLERFLNTRVHLKLFVRVEPRWTRSAKSIKKMGYEQP